MCQYDEPRPIHIVLGYIRRQNVLIDTNCPDNYPGLYDPLWGGLKRLWEVMGAQRDVSGPLRDHTGPFWDPTHFSFSGRFVSWDDMSQDRMFPN